MKIRPLGAEQFHADRQTDVTKLTVAFHNFVNMPKNKQKKNDQLNFVQMVHFLEICGMGRWIHS
jgi:hypothetical protein